MHKITFKLEVLSIIVSIIIFIVIIDLVRRKKMREDLSFIWLIAGFLIFVISLFPQSLFYICKITGFMTPAGMVFFFGIVFLICITLQFSIHISKVQNDIKNIVQKIALLEHKIEVLTRKEDEKDNKETGG
ncbi:MAG: DUF2304 domain-containing protein [Candidatus Hydrogenedentota bacterium]